MSFYRILYWASSFNSYWSC